MSEWQLQYIHYNSLIGDSSFFKGYPILLNYSITIFKIVCYCKHSYFTKGQPRFQHRRIIRPNETQIIIYRNGKNTKGWSDNLKKATYQKTPNY